jgi:hypothetical protein
MRFCITPRKRLGATTLGPSAPRGVGVRLCGTYAARGQDQVRAWPRTFAGNNRYERVRAEMLVAGVLRRSSRRRFGLVKTDTYTAATDREVLRR